MPRASPTSTRCSAIEARLTSVGGRRIPLLFALLFSWASLTLGLGLIADRRGVRAGMRIGALAVLWLLPMLLLTGWLAPRGSSRSSSSSAARSCSVP